MAAIKNSVGSLFLLFLFAFAVEGQVPFLKHKVSVNYAGERLEDVMLSLADVGGFSFSYNPKLLPVDSLIQLKVQNSTIKSIMNALLGEELEYRVSGNLLVILKTKFNANPGISSGESKKTNTVKGYLKDAETGEFVSNTTVYDVQGLKSTVTNQQGYFSLEIPDKEQVIAIGVISNKYQETAVVLLNKDQQVNIPVIQARRPQIQQYGQSESEGDKVNALKVVKFITSEEGRQRSGNVALSNYRFAQTSFVPFIGTNLKMSGTVENKFSLNVLAGYNGASKGLEVGGLFNINRFHSRGVQVAGIGNIVGTETNGLQVSGIFNTNLGFVKGLQVAGINNLVLDSLRGVQVSGINNMVIGSTTGVQVAGINNYAKNDVDGIQVAGISNVAMKDVNNIQIAGIVNLAKDVEGIQIAGIGNFAANLRSFQLSGVVNIATDTVKGVQLSSVINFAKFNEGVQIGLINIGRSSPGTSIGLLNFFSKGYNKIELAGNTILPLNVKLKFGNRKFYNMIGLGTRGFAKNQVWGYTYGIGRVVSIGKNKNDLNFDLSVTDLQNDDTWFEEVNLNTRLGIYFGYHLNDRFMLFGGPVFNHLSASVDHLEENGFLLDLPPYTIYNTEIGGNRVQGWLGIEMGIRLL